MVFPMYSFYCNVGFIPFVVSCLCSHSRWNHMTCNVRVMCCFYNVNNTVKPTASVVNKFNLDLKNVTVDIFQ